MTQLDHWFYQRTGFYPTAMLKKQLEKAFLEGYLIIVELFNGNNQSLQYLYHTFRKQGKFIVMVNIL